MLQSRSWLAFALIGCAFLFNSCDTSTPPNAGQEVADVAWKSDESGLVGLVQQALTFPRQYSVTLLGADGAIQSTISTSDKATGQFSPSILLSQDNASAVVELNRCDNNGCTSNVYTVPVSSGSAAVLVPNTNLLAASPDLKQVVVLQSSGSSSRRLVTVLDYSTSPTSSHQFFVDSLATSRGLWLNNNRIALTLSDSIKDAYYVAIFDTAGHKLMNIPNAEVSLHGTAYVPSTNELFVRQNDWHIAKIDMNTNARTLLLPNDSASGSVSSMSVSPDGKAMVYTLLYEPTNVLHVLNIATGATAVLSNDHALFSVVSPLGDKVAYVNFRSDSFNEVKVIPLVVP